MATMTTRADDLARIKHALRRAAEILRGFEPGGVAFQHKLNSDPVTSADLELDHALREELLDEGEGWLSEETADSAARLAHERVWVVDPLDGTREFVQGIPEWAVSIGLVEDGVAVAGGILNPAAGFMALGALGLGCSLNGIPVRASNPSSLDGALVLASRTEVGRGQWQNWSQANFTIQPMGSVAYKLARVACGLADATWTLVPKNEWDVAGGVALVVAAGGWATTLDGGPPRFNRPNPALRGLVASGPGLLNTLTPDWLQEVGELRS
jgi:myo-inositol-1(or 4)-monophosphatase